MFRWTRVLFAIACLLLKIESESFADEDFRDRFLKDDNEYRYYLGSAERMISDAEAVLSATILARRQAISENFGSLVSFETNSFRDGTGDALLSSRGSEASGQVMLDRFEEVKRKVERDNGKVSVWILFRYPKSSIAAERLRLDELKKEQRTGLMAAEEIGGESDSSSTGSILIKTSPPRLAVRIGNQHEIFGKKLRSPILVKGLPEGEHVVVIDEPSRQLVRKVVTVVRGSNSVVDVAVPEATATLIVETNPPGATVAFSGRAELSPTKPFNVPAGKEIEINISHPETKGSMRVTTLLSRGEKRKISYNLSLLPITIDIASIPHNAEIFLNGKATGIYTNGALEAEARKTHEITLRRDGYLPYSVKIPPTQGGRAVLLDTLTLTKSESKESYEQTQSDENDTSFYTRLNLGALIFSGPIFTDKNLAANPGSYYVGIEQNILSFINLSFMMGYGDESIEYKNGTILKSNTLFGASVSICNCTANSYWFFRPGFLSRTDSYAFTPINGKKDTRNMSVNFNEYSIGHHFQSPDGTLGLGLGVGHFFPNNRDFEELTVSSISSGFLNVSFQW